MPETAVDSSPATSPENVHPGPAAAPRSDHPEAGRGIAFAVGAYSWWGLAFPFYLRTVNDAAALELLVMRVVFGLPVILGVVLVSRKVGELKRVVTTWRSLRQLLITTPLIAANWYAFTYAVVSDQLAEASFGYYINPLVTIALGMIFLGERLRPAQWVAVSIAAVATVLLGIGLGGVPLIALTVASTFGIYGLLRKRADANAATGLSVEMGVLFVPMLAIEAWLWSRGEMKFGGGDLRLTLMMTLAGAMTVVPLTLFTAGAKRIRLSTIGLLQYIAPTGQLIAALWFGQHLTGLQWTAFAIIWAAIAVFTWDSLRNRRREMAARRVGANARAAAEARD